MSDKKGKGKPKETGELEKEARAAFHNAMEAFGIEANRCPSSKDTEASDFKMMLKMAKWSPPSAAESSDSQVMRCARKRRSGSNDDEPVLAASASNENGACNDDSDTCAVEEQLKRRVRHYFDDTDPSHATLSFAQARRLLEASSGDLDLAAGFYWDEYFASTANGTNNADDDDHRLTPKRRVQYDTSHVNGERSNHSADAKGNDDQEPSRDNVEPNAMARRLEHDDRIRHRLDDRLHQAEEFDEQMVDADEVNDDEDLEGGVDGAVDIPAEVGVAAVPHNVAGSVSVSDDEAGAAGIWRMAGRRQLHLQPEASTVRTITGETVQNFGFGGNEMDSSYRQRSKLAEGGLDGHEGDEEECLSDTDWLLNDNVASPHAIRPPTEILWGMSDAELNASNDADNFINPEDEGDDDNVLQGIGMVGIPTSWLNAGFHMAACGTGLVLKEPHDDDSITNIEQNSQGVGAGNVNGPPFHCQGITSLPAIITVMIYTGASVQGNAVDCSSSRTPFVYLSEKERVEEFDSRLVDAITALLHIALRSSTDRKKRILERQKSSNIDGSDAELKKEQMIQRKLRLCPTCHWKEDLTGEPSVPKGKSAGQRVRLRTSYTSGGDLRAYVLSNFRSFTGRGGCALLLETIVTIHGPGSISRMIRKAQRAAGLPSQGSIKLVSCNCNHHQSSTSQTSSSMNSCAIPDSSLLPNYNCMSIELLSLLLTGTVHSKLSGWSTGGLGFGILSQPIDRVGSALSRPEQPVWLVREGSCYNVMWLDRSKSDDGSVSNVDMAGNSFYLVHWNGLFGTHKNRSGTRVITARQSWSPPKLARTRTLRLDVKLSSKMERKHMKQSKKVIVSSDEHEEISGPTKIIEQEILQVKVHPDDQKYYPNSFKMWRYDVEEPFTIQDDKGERVVMWTPFFKLTDHQQQTIATKLAPNIVRILWTRWPKAAIDIVPTVTDV